MNFGNRGEPVLAAFKDHRHDPNSRCDAQGCGNFIRVGFNNCLPCLVKLGVLKSDGSRADPSRDLALPEDHAARKAIPVVSGCWDYFPAALAAVAELSRIGNEQHNPGEPMHHARGKSNDHADCIGRHLMDRGRSYKVVINGVEHKVRHSVAVAWRALALAQEELEREEGKPLARGAKAAK